MVTRINYRKLAFEAYPPIRAHCGFGVPEVPEVAHLDGNRNNNAAENLAILCPNCHKMHDIDPIPTETIELMRDREKRVAWRKRMKDAGAKALPPLEPRRRPPPSPRSSTRPSRRNDARFDRNKSGEETMYVVIFRATIRELGNPCKSCHSGRSEAETRNPCDSNLSVMDGRKLETSLRSFSHFNFAETSFSWK